MSDRLLWKETHHERDAIPDDFIVQWECEKCGDPITIVTFWPLGRHGDCGGRVVPREH